MSPARRQLLFACDGYAETKDVSGMRSRTSFLSVLSREQICRNRLLLLQLETEGQNSDPLNFPHSSPPCFVSPLLPSCTESSEAERCLSRPSVATALYRSQKQLPESPWGCMTSECVNRLPRQNKASCICKYWAEMKIERGTEV